MAVFNGYSLNMKECSQGRFGEKLDKNKGLTSWCCQVLCLNKIFWIIEFAKPIVLIGVEEFRRISAPIKPADAPQGGYGLDRS